MTITVQHVLDRLMEPVPRLETTVDTLKSGDPQMEVKAIATTFMVTYEVIKQAISLGVNLLITHEGTFFRHQDQTEGLQEDPVYQEKIRLIRESGLAIFRFHDTWHRYRPDGIMEGLLRELGWQTYVEENKPASTILSIPAMTVRELADDVKRKLGAPFVRVVGDLSMTCSRIGVLVGYRGGGSMAIPLLENEDLDLILSGEGPEWETPEYVRDAAAQGKQKALLVLGHAVSEEPGMKYLAERIKMMFPGIPVHHIPAKQPFVVV